jgi:hypothetical protein
MAHEPVRPWHLQRRDLRGEVAGAPALRQRAAMALLTSG